MSLTKCSVSNSRIRQGLAHLGMFLLGAIILSIFSIFQKNMLGVEITLEARAFVVPVLFGGATGLIVSIFLIRLRTSNLKLSHSQAHLQDFMDNASDLIQSISPTGKILYTNRTWQETLGYTPSELETFNIFELIAEEYHSHCQFQMNQVLAGKTVHDSFALMAKNGNRVYVDGMMNCRFQDGKPVSTRGILRDVTKNREAEEKLRLAAKVYENVNDGIFVTNRSAEIMTVNQGLTSITGYTKEQIINRMPTSFILVEDNSQQTIEDLHQGLSTMSTWQGEVIARRKDQSRFPASIKITAVKNDDGNTLNYIGVLTDITLRKETEERLRHLATHDLLTNLPNRMLFVDQLQKAVWYAEQTETKLAVLYLDLDGFKKINDTYGHGTGDAFLKAIARRLLEVAGSSSLARLGGDEFAILKEKVSSEQEILNLAGKILKVLSAPVYIEKTELSTTVSIGISIYPNCPNPNSLMSNADVAMYKAKANGKNAAAFLS